MTGPSGGPAATRERLRADVGERIRRVRERLARASDADLARPLPDGWTVGLAFLHIALGLRRQAKWLERASAGRPPFPFRWETTHRLNAYVLARYGECTRTFIDGAVDVGAVRMTAALERLAPADLERVALLVGGRPVSLAVVVARIVLRHVDEHLVAIETALATG